MQHTVYMNTPGDEKSLIGESVMLLESVDNACRVSCDLEP